MLGWIQLAQSDDIHQLDNLIPHLGKWCWPWFVLIPITQ
jgi:hypothetical protein